MTNETKKLEFEFFRYFLQIPCGFSLQNIDLWIFLSQKAVLTQSKICFQMSVQGANGSFRWILHLIVR